MEKLDVKDRKILYELDLDSRQSFSQLGKKVGLSKDVVAYRVKKLQEKGIIKNFFTEMNCYRLGYSKAKFYLNFQNITPEIRQEIIDYFEKSSFTNIIHSLEGQYDLVVINEVNNIPKFYNIWKNAINKYRDFFSNQVFCVESMSTNYKKTFLLEEKPENKEDRRIFTENSNDTKVKIDSVDKKILDLLAPNARMPTLEIAEKLDTTVTTINSRIKRLMKTGVIQRYSINIDYPKIGYQWYKADIILKNPEKMQQITEYIQNNPHLLFKVVSVGYVDLELTFILSNVNQFHQIIGELSSKFPDTIRNYKYFSVIKTYKYERMDFWNR